jgi:hypothetical protein
MQKINKTLKQLGYETLKLIVFALIISLFIPQVEATIRTDLWLYSNFSLNANDSSGNARHGINTGATMNLTGGKLDGAYKYTTDDKISYNGYGMLDNGDRQYFTINVWVKSTRDDIYNTVFSEGCTSSDNCIFTHRGNTDSDGKTETFMRDQAGTTKISSVENTRVLFNNTWNMLTWVRNGTNWRVHVNGIQASSGTGFSGESVANFNTFNLGVLQRTGYALYYEGAIDEFGVWNRTFKQQDVDGLFAMYNLGCNPINNATLCGPPTTQTPTPTGLINDTQGITNVTLGWGSFWGNYGSKYLLFRNGTNVANWTYATNPAQYIDTGLTNNTRYGYKVKAYNTTYTNPLSNFSNLIEVRTLQTTPTASVTLKTDIQNSGNYTMNPFVYRFNGTTTAPSTQFNCTLWINPAYTSGEYIVSKTVSDITLNQNVTFDTTGVQANYDTQFLCRNSYTNSSLLRQFGVDTVTPVITYAGFTNNSVYYKNINTEVTINLTYTDQNLFAVNYTVCRGVGNTCTNVTANFFYTNILTREINESNAFTIGDAAPAYLRNGRYIVKGEAWDSHTAKNIEDYAIDYITDGTKTGFKVDDSIEITSPDADVIELTKNNDRYNFDVVLKEPTDEIIFNLKSNSELTYLPNSEYLGHFVDFDNKKWIDFENPNTESVTYTKISDNEYQINVHMKPQKVGVELGINEPITFNSIGDLNEIRKYWYFNVSNPQVFRAKDLISNVSIQNITVKVYTYPNTLIQQKSTTNYNVSFNITDGTYYVNITGNAGGVNYNTNVTANFTFSEGNNKLVYLSLANSLYLLIYDEQTNELINDRNVTIDVINYQNVSNRYTTDTGSTFKSEFAAGYYEINYKASNYTARSYYTTIAGGDTQTITLYLLTNLDSTHSYKLLEVIDESASPLPNSTVKMQRYFIDENAWKTVEMTKTNDEGKGFVFAELYDATYRFVIDYGGITRKTTTETKLDTRDLFLSINLLDSGLDSYFAVADVTATLDYSNNTKVWTYNFNALTVSEVDDARFLVTQKTPTVETVICNTTLVASSGGIACNLTSVWEDDGEFYGHGFVTTDDGREHLLFIESIKTAQEYLNYGLNGVLMSMMIIGTLAFLGLFNPAIAVGLALVGLVITTMTGLLYLSTSWVIGIIVVGLIFIFTMRT